MRRRTLIHAMCMLIGLIALPFSANAQDEKASVVVLQFEDRDAGEDMVDSVLTSVERGIEAHPEMTVKTRGEMTVKDLAVTAGCEKPDRECMRMLSDFIDADRVVFGSVQRSDDVYLFSMKMFDFPENRFVAEVSDQTVQGSPARVKQVLPAIVESFLYGDVGVLKVETTGADSPDIIFDGQKIGLAPTTLENLPLGEHVVTVKTADGDEQTKTVVLRHNDPVALKFDFGPDEVAEPGRPSEPSAGKPSVVPGIVALGVGAVGAAVGVYSSLQVQKAEDDNAALEPFVAEDGRSIRDQDAVAAAEDEGLVPPDIDRRGENFETIQWVGYGVAAAGAITGAILLYRPLFGGEQDPKASARNFDVGFAPTRGGAAATFKLRF